MEKDHNIEDSSNFEDELVGNDATIFSKDKPTETPEITESIAPKTEHQPMDPAVSSLLKNENKFDGDGNNGVKESDNVTANFLMDEVATSNQKSNNSVNAFKEADTENKIIDSVNLEFNEDRNDDKIFGKYSMASDDKNTKSLSGSSLDKNGCQLQNFNEHEMLKGLQGSNKSSPERNTRKIEEVTPNNGKSEERNDKNIEAEIHPVSNISEINATTIHEQSSTFDSLVVKQEIESKAVMFRNEENDDLKAKNQQKCCDHPKNFIVLVCVICNTLVCPECVVSGKHKSHTFQHFQSYIEELKQKIMDVLQHLQKFKSQIPDQEHSWSLVERALVEKREEIKQTVEQHGNRLVSKVKQVMCQREREIDEFFLQENSIFVKWQNIQKKTWEEAEEDCGFLTKVLQDCISASNIEDLFIIENRTKKYRHVEPSVSFLEMVGKSNISTLIEEAMGEFDVKQPLLIPDGLEQKMQHQSKKKFETSQIYMPIHRLMVVDINCNPNTDQKYTLLFLESMSLAWAISKNDKRLVVINEDLKELKSIQGKENIGVVCLSFDYTSDDIYVGCEDNTIKKIETGSNLSSTIAEIGFQPNALHMIKNDLFLTGSNQEPLKFLYCYSCAGKLVKKSLRKMIVWEIDCTTNCEKILVASGTNGAIILDSDLLYFYEYKGKSGQLQCFSAVFDTDGSALVADKISKEIHVLHALTFAPVKTISLPFFPDILKLFHNTMWIQDDKEIAVIKFQ